MNEFHIIPKILNHGHIYSRSCKCNPKLIEKLGKSNNDIWQHNHPGLLPPIMSGLLMDGRKWEVFTKQKEII
ncbi:MAG: hypothetical protein AABY22_24680 [Nanoarchaeota archaeon]